MRSIDYRRKEEAKHYKKRLSISIHKKYYKEMTVEDGESKLIPLAPYKNHSPWIGRESEERALKKNRNRRWIYALKNNSVPSEMTSYSKKLCNRTRRHFQKMVDYQIPEKRFLVRAQVIYPREIGTYEYGVEDAAPQKKPNRKKYNCPGTCRMCLWGDNNSTYCWWHKRETEPDNEQCNQFFRREAYKHNKR